MGGLERNICSRSLKSGSCSWDKNTHIGKKMQAGCTVLMYFKSTLDQQFLLWAHTSLRLQKTPPEGSGHRPESITVGCLRRNTSRCWHKTLVGYFNKIIALVWLITGHIFDKSIFKNHEKLSKQSLSSQKYNTECSSFAAFWNISRSKRLTRSVQSQIDYQQMTDDSCFLGGNAMIGLI